MSLRLRVGASNTRKRKASEDPEEKLPTLHQPLSLEETALCYIIAHLERYPPDVLALLPLAIRRDLLLLLPSADIFQLEQTQVTNGIDMENEIWKVLCERFFNGLMVPRTDHIDEDVKVGNKMNGRFSYLNYSCRSPSWELHQTRNASMKARFVTHVSNLLLYIQPFQMSVNRSEMCKMYSNSISEKKYVIFSQLLLCNQFFTLKQLASIGGFPLQVSGTILHPSRYSELFSRVVSVPEWMQFLLEECHLLPPSEIPVIMNPPTLTLNEAEHTVQNHSQIQRFFSQTRDLRVLFSHFPSLPSKFLSQTLSSVVAVSTNRRDRSKLENPETLLDRRCLHLFSSMLSLLCHLERIKIVQPESRRHACGQDRRVFAPDHLDEFLQNLFLHPAFSVQADCTSSIDPDVFRGLKHIQVYCNNAKLTLSTLCSLLVFTQNQCFESILIDDSPLINGIDKRKVLKGLITTDCFTAPISPSCTSITLRRISPLPFWFLRWLLTKFLYSPSNSPQTLTVAFCRLDYSVVPSEKELVSIDSIPVPSMQ